MNLKDRLQHRMAKFVLKHAQPEEVVREPGDLLKFPDDHAFKRPTLLAFGEEPGVSVRPWVEVGKYSSLNGGTRIMLGGGHHPEWVSTYAFRARLNLPGAFADGQPQSRGPVTIGNDVWIGYDVVIMSGVTIGDGAVIGTRSLVTKDVAPYEVVGGCPAQHIRYRFDDDTIAALRRIEWWNWPDEKVLEYVPALCSDDTETFITEHDPLNSDVPGSTLGSIGASSDTL